MDKKLFLLDAYALIFRSYYAFIKNPRINSKGLNTSAIFGFALTLDEILKKEMPTHIAVVFDPPGPTFRHIQYPEYKANREETPEDIKLSVPYIKRLIESYNIPVIEVEGFEADDTVGTLAGIASQKGFTTYLMTPDKDYAQLVNENTFMYKPNRSGKGVEILGIEEVKETFGVGNPLQVIDVLGLMGDTSDNVPGCPGIGPKTAKKLIAKYGSIENLYENTNDLKGKQKDNVIEYKDQVLLSKDLVTIRTNVPVDFNEELLLLRSPNEEKVRELYEELEFRTLMQRFAKPEGIVETKSGTGPVQGNLFAQSEQVTQTEVPSPFKTIDEVDHDYQLVNTKEQREKFIKELKKQKSFCFDTETTGLEFAKSNIIGLAFSFEKAKAYYVPVPIEFDQAKNIIKEFEEVFFDSSIEKVGQNIKYDILMLMNYDIKVNGDLFDTLIAHYLIQPEQKHGLNFLAETYLDYSPVSIETLIGKKGKTQLNMKDVPVEKVKEYAGEDADITWQLKNVFEPKLEEEGLMQLFRDMEMPLISVLASMEYTGVRLSVPILDEYAKKLNQELINLEKSIYEDAGKEFNISSPKQLGVILFEELKIDDKVKKTKTKQFSTSEDTLIKLKDKHPIIEKVLEFRSVKKLLSTYIEALPKLIADKTGKIHTSFNQAIAATGRLSSNNPNLQNIPIREERGREIRKAFVPQGEDYLLLSADYSQIELRLMAHLSKDESMIHDFNHEADIHQATAAKIYKIPTEDVSREMRSRAKTANFGIIYGISAFGLSQRLNISRSEAKELIDGYFETYPAVKEYMDSSISKAREQGYTKTICGRKRWLNDINSRNAIVRGVAERNAINAPIQGSAADIIKMAMIKIHKSMKESGMKSSMILQVHDELVFDVYKPELDQLKNLVKKEMEQVMELSVPLTTEMGEGNNWLEAH